MGESEKAVARAFEAAKEMAPAIVFIDEFQALFADRNSGEGTGVGAQLASQLMVCMDDLARAREVDVGGVGANVMVLAATNAPQAVDPAFLRPGRFDEVVYTGLPTKEERAAILDSQRCTMMSRQAAAEGGGEADGKFFVEWSTEVDTMAIASRTHGFSGADLVNLVRRILMAALEEVLEGPAPNQSMVILTQRHFDEALSAVLPSTPLSTLSELETWGKTCRAQKTL